MAREFGSQVDLWITEDLPMSNALQAYVTGGFPPGGRVLSSPTCRPPSINLAYANAAAYDAIHANDNDRARPEAPT